MTKKHKRHRVPRGPLQTSPHQKEQRKRDVETIQELNQALEDGQVRCMLERLPGRLLLLSARAVARVRCRSKI